MIPAVRYNIFRSMDKSIFMLDAKRREQGVRSAGFYDAEVVRHPFSLNLGDIIKIKADEPDYSAFTNNMLYVLANFPDMEDAFSKLTEKPVKSDDPKHQDKDTEIPAPGSYPASGDPSKLLYTDKTLDGRGTNSFFYRIRTIDEIGNLGDYSSTTMPVCIPKIRPPNIPQITKVIGGELSITIEWEFIQEEDISDFNIYRTTNEIFVNDVRRMELINILPYDATVSSYSVVDDGSVVGELPEDQNPIGSSGSILLSGRGPRHNERWLNSGTGFTLKTRDCCRYKSPGTTNLERGQMGQGSG